MLLKAVILRIGVVGVQVCSVARQRTPHTSAVVHVPRDPQEMEPLVMTWMRLVHLRAICLSGELWLKCAAFWDVMLCSPVEVYWNFRGTSLSFYSTSLWHIPEGHALHTQHCENCKSNMWFLITPSFPWWSLFLNNLCGSCSIIMTQFLKPIQIRCSFYL
jgi:hypothetical protein